MTSDEIIGFKKSSKINGLKLDETCRTPNSYFKRRVLIFYKKLPHRAGHGTAHNQWINQTIEKFYPLLIWSFQSIRYILPS